MANRLIDTRSQINLVAHQFAKSAGWIPTRRLLPRAEAFSYNLGLRDEYLVTV